MNWETHWQYRDDEQAYLCRSFRVAVDIHIRCLIISLFSHCTLVSGDRFVIQVDALLLEHIFTLLRLCRWTKGVSQDATTHKEPNAST